MKFSHFVPNKIIYTMIMICILLFFPHVFLLKFYAIFTKFLEVLGTWKYFIKFSYHVGLNFISIIDGWTSLSLYQYMSWVGGCRTPMTIWIPIRASISSGLVGYQFLFGVATMCFREQKIKNIYILVCYSP